MGSLEWFKVCLGNEYRRVATTGIDIFLDLFISTIDCDFLLQLVKNPTIKLYEFAYTRNRQDRRLSLLKGADKCLYTGSH